tara:strand:- start:190 stop:918 length:729 start_codon:yes stop_codon:yes gene_type:complete
MFGGKPTEQEKEYMNALGNRRYSDVISNSELNNNIITGTRGALGQFNDQVNQGIGVMESQGLGDSVLATQVGLKERANIADGLNTTAIDAKQNAIKVNAEAKRQAEAEFFDLKNKLATRRQEVSQGGFQNMVSGATDVVGYLNEPKYLQNLMNRSAQKPTMGYTPTINPSQETGFGTSNSYGSGFGRSKSSLEFGQKNAYGLNTPTKVAKKGRDTIKSSELSDAGLLRKKNKKGSRSKGTNY